MTTIVDTITGYGKIRHFRMSDPANAHGNCFVTSDALHRHFDSADIELIYADHDNDPLGRLDRLNQYANHYALYADDKVVDFTLRQFKHDTPWPFVGSVEEWKDILSAAWETDRVSLSRGSELCGSCSAPERNCECCCAHCDNYLARCECVHGG